MSKDESQQQVPPVKKKRGKQPPQKFRTINEHSRAVKRDINTKFKQRRKEAYLKARETGVWELPQELVDKFWATCDKSGDCWVWTGKLDKKGYGAVSGFHERIASRVAYQLTHGVIQEGICVLHKCDNPKCINPDHLFTGTQQDNMTDKKLKGRARGPKKINQTI